MMNKTGLVTDTLIVSAALLAGRQPWDILASELADSVRDRLSEYYPLHEYHIAAVSVHPPLPTMAGDIACYTVKVRALVLQHFAHRCAVDDYCTLSAMRDYLHQMRPLKHDLSEYAWNNKIWQRVTLLDMPCWQCVREE